MMEQLVDRMLRASKLDPGLYEEVEADTSALGQAALVVVLSSIAGGIGLGGLGGIGGILGATSASLVGWVIWAGLVYLIGTKLLPSPRRRPTSASSCGPSGSRALRGSSASSV